MHPPFERLFSISRSYDAVSMASFCFTHKDETRQRAPFARSIELQGELNHPDQGQWNQRASLKKKKKS